jgi:hypothetical protein
MFGMSIQFLVGMGVFENTSWFIHALVVFIIFIASEVILCSSTELCYYMYCRVFRMGRSILPKHLIPVFKMIDEDDCNVL